MNLFWCKDIANQISGILDKEVDKKIGLTSRVPGPGWGRENNGSEIRYLCHSHGSR